jgi:hypothetical protein
MTGKSNISLSRKAGMSDHKTTKRYLQVGLIVTAADSYVRFESSGQDSRLKKSYIGMLLVT